jgi:hypothetical protein
MAVNGGVKNWASGEVLDAEELNEFVADQTIARFATIADRTAAYGVSGAPSLQKGLFSWVEETEKLYFYSGTAWVEVGAQIEAGEITNTEISATAAIALSKLASGTSAQVIVHNSSGVPTATTVTGDVTISNTGVTSIGSGVIVNADINASAAIDKTKISGTAITAADTGTVTSTILADRSVGSSEFNNLSFNPQIGTSYTLALSDAHKLVTLSNSNQITLTIPTDSVAAFEPGDQVNLLQLGSGQVTISGAGVQIRSEGNKLKIKGQYAIVTCVKIAANEWVVIGNLSA